MKPRSFRLILTLVVFITLSFNLVLVTHAQSQHPTHQYSPLTLSSYHRLRNGYVSLPVRILVMGGGKRSADEKFRLHVSSLKNETPKYIKAVRFTCFIFNRNDPNQLLGTELTPLIPLDLPANAERKFEIIILYIDDIPLLAYKPGQEFRLEVAVSEVHYDDGTIWQGKDLPGKLVLPEGR